MEYRLAIVSKIRDIDFKDVLSYELSSVPLSLSTLDGSLRKPNKTVLLHELGIERETITELQQFQGQTATILDTDAEVLCLFHCSTLNFIDLWFHTGTGKQRRFIPMHVIAEKLSEEIIRVLLAFYTHGL